MTRALRCLALALVVISFRQNGLAQQNAERVERAWPRHSVSVYAPDVTLRYRDEGAIYRPGLARVTSASVAYHYLFPGDTWTLGALIGPATTHPQLREVAGRWSGVEFGVTGGVGGTITPNWWIGGQLRLSWVRAPFRLDGYVPVAGQDYFEPALDVRSALRQNNVEFDGLTRILLGDSGLFLNLEGGLNFYGRGIFSDVDLYPGFDSECNFLFCNVVRLPQNRYNTSLALRARLGLGFTF